MREEAWRCALREGDISWFPELVEAYKDRIYALAFRKTRNAAEAEDLAQEVFLQFYRKLPLFRGEAALSTWLYRVALNRASSYIRKRTPVPLPGAPPDTGGGAPPEERLLAEERTKALLAALARLNAHEREVLELFYFQQHSTARTAEILGISPRGVETRLRRARQRMKHLLGDTGDFDDEEVGRHGVPGRTAGLHATKLS